MEFGSFPSPPLVPTDTDAPPLQDRSLSRIVALIGTLLAVLLAARLPTYLPRLRRRLGITLAGGISTGIPAAPPIAQTPAEASATARLLARLTPSQLALRRETLERLSANGAERARLLNTLSAFGEYLPRALSGVSRKRRSFVHRLARTDRLLLADYGGKLDRTEVLLRQNAALVGHIYRHALAYYAVSAGEVARDGDGGDHAQLTQALKHFVRDWSADGTVEREVGWAFVRGALLQHAAAAAAGKPNGNGNPRRVLVPGCGVGGLLWEVAGMGYETVGVEMSFYMNIMNHFLASAPPEPHADEDVDVDVDVAKDGDGDGEHRRRPWPKKHTYHPYLDWWSHHTTVANMLRPVRFPEGHLAALLPPYTTTPPSTHPNIPHLLESSFLAIPPLPTTTTTTTRTPATAGPYDFILTYFFLDTAQNILSYLRQLHALLAPQTGVWINFGPLLYGTRPWVELSLEEIVAVAESLGFEFEIVETASWGGGQKATAPGTDTLGNGKVRGWSVGYNVDWKGMGRNGYIAQGWVARRKI